ncbi:MAG: hydrogenase nickel incorporation protein HypB [Anaerolineae bacterium]|nr:hydrogenase nickel incorporation protein HypB [Anaerolineae bacterium]
MTHIPVVQNILNANDIIAEVNRNKLESAHVFGLNIMASPGAGKTSLIEHTIRGLADVRVGIINGDTAGYDGDALRAQNAGAKAVHINTGGNCHLEAHMIQDALVYLDLPALDLVIIENVGNLVCPAGWKLGTHHNVLVASIPEGADKPYKYPNMYHGVDVLIINKIDLLPYIPFDMEYFKKGVMALNPKVTVFEVSCQTGQGLDGWYDWVRGKIRR